MGSLWIGDLIVMVRLVGVVVSFLPKVDLTDAESTLYGGIASSRCMYEWTVTGTVHKVELSDEWDWIGLIAQ